MTTNAHTNCTHAATKAARAACRREAARGNAAPKITRAARIHAAGAAEAARCTPAADVDYSGMTYSFDSETCYRCSGTGSYPSSAWNGVCLNCKGSGKSLTRAGRAAKKAHDAWVETHLMIAVTDIQPGMKIMPSAVDGWKTITDVDMTPRKNGTYTIGSGDNAVTHEMWSITVTYATKHDGPCRHGLSVEGTVRRSATPAERNALIASLANRKGLILTPKN